MKKQKLKQTDDLPDEFYNLEGIDRAYRDGRTYCPVCGEEFGVIHAENFCLRCSNVSAPEDLIGEDDNYAWCV